MVLGAEKLKAYEEIKLVRIKIKGTDLDKAISVLKADPEVEYAEPNYYVRPCYDPNDPRLPDQYAMDIVHARQAWDISRSPRSATICVLDSGVRLDHEELAGKILPESLDIADNDADITDDAGGSVSGHGTHCSGIAVAGTDNGLGVSSLCFNGKLLHYKIIGRRKAFATIGDICTGLILGSQAKARIFSMSFGTTLFSQAQQDIVNYVWSQGGILFAAAGNNGNQVPFFPAAMDNVVSVAATNRNDQRAGFSNFGSWVKVAAPGDQILSSWNGSRNDYLVASGTSMACPMAASLAGLLLGTNSRLTNVQIRDIIFSTCQKKGFDFVSEGRIDAFKAVSRVGRRDKG